MGYIGLPTGIILAKAGHDVLGIDVDENKVKTINEGNPHFFEPDLEEALKEVIKNDKFKASLKIEIADIL